MKELSVLIDESGDFGETRDVRDYYLVTFVFHDQSEDISAEIRKLEEHIHQLCYGIEYIHTGPIVRREGIFESFTLDERRRMLYTIFNFALKCPVCYYTIVVKRKEATDRVQLSGKLGKALNQMLSTHHKMLDSFDKVIVYYDGGQKELSSILSAVFSFHLSNVEFRKADPREYKLLQVADFFCSIELLRIKRDENRLSNTEDKFFYKSNELKKVFIKGIEKKRLKDE